MRDPGSDLVRYYNTNTHDQSWERLSFGLDLADDKVRHKYKIWIPCNY